MRKLVGHVQLQGKRLTYYVIGDSNRGYGVQITETCIEKAGQILCTNLDEALQFAQKLRRCSVFPSNLAEVVQDQRVDHNID